jgi:hypothetical protein
MIKNILRKAYLVPLIKIAQSDNNQLNKTLNITSIKQKQ